jgi:hypothetical protein
MARWVSARMPARLTSLLLLLLSASALRASDLESATATVARIRGTAFRHPVAVKTLRRADLDGYFRAQIARSTQGSADEYVTSLEALQLIEPGGDPLAQLITLYQAQVLAFYSPTEHVYYQLDEPPPGTPANPIMNLMVERHELTHALQDQVFGAGERLASIETDWDAQLAYQSVLEGEATLMMLAALADTVGQPLETLLKNEQMMETLANVGAMDQAMPKETPRYYSESMVFPYSAGLLFVIDAYRRDGWKALDAVYQRPPVSSAEILHPALYFDRTFRPVILAKAEVPAPYHVLDSTLGEFHWRFLLQDPALAATWRADRVQIVENAACEPTVLIDTRWATAADALRFRDAYVGKLAAHGIGAVTAMDGTGVRVAYGADAKLTQSFAAGTMTVEVAGR